MIAPRRPAGTSALAREVRAWATAEAQDRELQDRVAVALDEIKDFIGSYQADVERRKSRLIQTPGFKDETRSMEDALGKIRLLVTGGRNISTVFAAIGGFLDAYQGEATFDGENVRRQLADARDDFFCRFHDAIHGTRLAELLDILCFMPHSYWRSRSVERRNFRSPSAAELSKLLEDFRQRGIDVDGIDTVRLAAMVRLRLGITPRMDYHRMPANKLAERLTSEEVISRCASGETPLDEAFCRTTAGMLAHLRRWGGACFGNASQPAPPAVEAEMLQLAYLASDIVRLGGTENERAADYLWLLATVIASDHAVVKDVLAASIDMQVGHPSIRARIAVVKTYLDEIAARADGILAARWQEAKAELVSLTARSEALAAKSKPDFSEFKELEALKEKRSDVVKALIKLADACQLIEPALAVRLETPGASACRSGPAGQQGVLDPAQLRDRNCTIADETKTIARQELEKLRLLIQRITAISRRGFADAGAGSPRPHRREQEQRARQTADGVDLRKLDSADLLTKLCGSIQKAALTLREFKNKVDGVRRRVLRSELQHALNILHERIRKAAEACDSFDPEAGDAGRISGDADGIAASLRDVMAAQTNVGARVNTAKLSPGEKLPLATLIATMKLRFGDDLRDIERLRAEIAERAAGPGPASCSAAGAAAVEATAEPEEAPVEAAVETDAAADGSDPARAPAAGIGERAPEDPARTAAVTKIAELVSAVNNAQKPVKALLIGLSGVLASEAPDDSAIRAAAVGLKNGITQAQDVMMANLMQIEAQAGAFTLPIDKYADRFDRWRGQLTALERETERLLRSMARVGDIRQAVAGAAAFEQGIANTLRPPPGESGRVEPFIPVRQRCRDALAAIADSTRNVREAQHSLRAARDAEWTILKAASGYVGTLCTDLAALEDELQRTDARIKAIHNRFKSDRSRPD